MSDAMMGVLQRQVESLTRQVEELGPENERVRNLLTEFDRRQHRETFARVRLHAQRHGSALDRQRIGQQADNSGQYQHGASFRDSQGLGVVVWCAGV